MTRFTITYLIKGTSFKHSKSFDAPNTEAARKLAKSLKNVTKVIESFHKKGKQSISTNDVQILIQK